MSSEKRKRARVQGGWAAPVASIVRSDRDKPKMPQGPAWLGKNIDVTPRPLSKTGCGDHNRDSEKQFVFTAPEPGKLKMKPPDEVITKPGVYNISYEPSGVSRLRYFPQFLDDNDTKGMFDELFHECPWRQRSVMREGIEHLQPRLTAWFGDRTYSYSRITHEVNKEWPAVIKKLQKHLEEVTGLTFNSVLANLYRDGHDSVDWHSDDEKALGTNPTIASLSFGDVRNFELRKKGEDPEFAQVMRVPLPHGSLLIMEGATQEDWLHRVPKEYHDRGPRINLTYRVIHPE